MTRLHIAWLRASCGLSTALLMTACSGSPRPATDQRPFPAVRYSAPTPPAKNQSLRRLFDDYYFGDAVSKNHERAEEYLKQAADADEEWAVLVLARRAESSAPSTALALYLKVARSNNCFAQERLVRASSNGELSERNLTQAYFWLLLAKVTKGSGRDLFRTAEFHFLADSSGESRMPSRGDGKYTCLPFIRAGSNIEASLPSHLVRLAQEAATKWRIGDVEPQLPASSTVASSPSISAPSGTMPTTPQPIPPVSRHGSRASASYPAWIPLRLSKSVPSRTDIPRDAAAIFDMSSRSVWIVVAGGSDAARSISQGSAVAVTARHLLTNCHVIDQQPLIVVKHANAKAEVIVNAGDRETDRCVLRAEKEIFVAPKGLRAYDTLKVGEAVYSIGSPSGLEQSLGQGIISGLRTLKGQRLIQTTAPISSGSSGGGLFDSYGNLIGITTFRIKDSQGLNFAIAIDEFVH